MDVNRLDVGLGIAISVAEPIVVVLISNPFHRENIRLMQRKPEDNRTVSK